MRAATTDTSVIRVFDDVRTAHLERLPEMTPSRLLYRNRMYDFDETAPGAAQATRCSRIGIARRLLTEHYEIVELNEPAMVRSWPSLALYAATIRLRNRMRSSKVRVAVYAIENNDVATSLGSRLRLPRILAAFACRAMVRFVLPSGSRVVFGTKQAEDLYHQLDPRLRERASIRVIEPLPAPCGICRVDKESQSVVFVGSFEERKGIADLIEAWPIVAARQGDATLHLVGQGPLLNSVRTWASARQDVALTASPTRAEIHEALRRAHVLVLFSNSELHWREQIGLPILEGLSHGCVVVASDQTGIADWLRGHGHVIAQPGSGESAPALALGILHGLADERPASRIQHDLPERDGRLVADDWLCRVVE